MKIVFNRKCLSYKFNNHPENPERVRRIVEILKQNGFSFVRAEKAKKEDILLVHTIEHFERVKNKNYFDFDTPHIDIVYPLISAGCAIKAAKIEGFSVSRPPGHHAGKDFLGGFCYFNNIAIAVEKLNLKTAILDLDAHHGNGTEDIFLGDERVLYVSLHEEGIFPGTGLVSRQNCINFPLPAFTEENFYLKTLNKALLEIKRFNPEILAISMGFDTYFKDPLTHFKLKKESYFKIGKAIKKLEIPFFVVLEGGYSEDIGELALQFLRGLID